MIGQESHIRAGRLVQLLRLLALAMCLVAVACMLAGCGGSGGNGNGNAGGGEDASGTTTGESFQAPATVAQCTFDPAYVTGPSGTGIDTSHLSEGYVGACGVSSSRLKLQVIKDGTAYNYDMPTDGTPMFAPLNMGDGTYTFNIMQNTTESRYAELLSETMPVSLGSEFAPFLHPSIFCAYTPDSAAVAKARQLVAGAQNEGDALRAIYTWIRDNITYDRAKASELSGKTGYIPNPDETLASGSGICFDYASLAAAMLRSQGIPCKIITGYVSPNGIYHAWNMVWIDGSWKTISIAVDPRTWTRVDITFAAGGDTSTVGNGDNYEDRYVY